MGAKIVDSKVDAAAHVLQQRHFRAGHVVEGGGVLQNGEISRFLHIGADRAHQPQGIVIEAAANVIVAPLGQGLVLMVGGAVGKLDGGDVNDPLPCPVGNNVHEAVKILTGIPEAHAPSGAGLVIGSGAAHIEGDHALILMPDVHHPVQLLVIRPQLIIAQQAVPVAGQFCKGIVHGRKIRKFAANPLGRVLADDTGSNKLLISGVFAIAQGEGGTPALTGGQGHFQPVAADGIPADDFGGCAPLLPDQLGVRPVAHVTQEGVPVRVPAGGGPVHAVEGIVIPPLPVLGFMINNAVLHFGFGNIQISLIILAVVHRVPQAPFHDAPDMDGLGFHSFVGQSQVMELAVFPHGHKEGHFRLQSVLSRSKFGITHAVTAFVAVQLGLGGQEAGVPGRFARFLDIIDPPAVVARDRVVAVAQQTLEFGIPVEAVAAARVGDHAEEVLAAQIVDPGQGRCGSGDHIFPPDVIKISVSHKNTS